MILGKKTARFLAFLTVLGLLCSAQGMTSLAGATGLGAVSSEEYKTGPGVSDQQQEQAPQTEKTQGGEQPSEEAGKTQPSQQPEGKPLQIEYYGYFHGQGWSEVTGDNHSLRAPAESWVTAMTANLVNIPAEAQIGVRYQVNLSGSGWLDWMADGAEAGAAGGDMPIEAVRMELTGSWAEKYDLYYRVFQNGQWSQWAANGERAGQEGAGMRVDGIRVSIVDRGTGEPEDSPGFQIDSSRPMVALTFDDGPKASVTNRILDILQASGGRATFFMVGSSVNANASVIQRMTAQGCEVANHTHDHRYLSKIGAQEIINQVTSTSQKIQAACGTGPTLVRPPGGYYDEASLSVLGSLGMPAVLWSIDTRDWQHRNPQKTIDSVLSQVQDGDIILMHDIYGTTADAVQVLVPELTARGFQLVTVSELAANRGGMVSGHVYSRFRP